MDGYGGAHAHISPAACAFGIVGGDASDNDDRLERPPGLGRSRVRCMAGSA